MKRTPMANSDLGATTVTTLSYSTTGPWHRRHSRRGVFLALVLGLVAAAATSWPHWGPGAIRTVRLLNRQHQCLTYRDPPDLIVFDEPADLHSRLQVEWPTHRQPWKTYNLAAGMPGRPATPCLAAVAAAHERYDFNRPSPGLTKLLDIGRHARRTVMFLHGRTTPPGQECLVVLELTGSADRVPNSGLVERNFSLRAHVIALATPSHPPRELHVSQWSLLGTQSSDFLGPFRFYAGQPDPQDPTHFTIRYEYDGQAGVIDGNLQSHGTLTLSVRDGPLPPLSGQN